MSNGVSPLWVVRAVSAILVLLFTSQSLAADQKEQIRECLQNHEESQLLRRAARLLEARDALQQCARSECPGPIRNDCSNWFMDVRALVPSVIVTAKAGGKRQTSVKVYVDDKLVKSELDGHPIELDPGEYRFRIVFPEHKEGAPCGGESKTCLERDIALAAGELGRVANFDADAAAHQKQRDASLGLGGPGPITPRDRPVPALTYVLGGAAVLLAGGGTYLWITASKERSDALADSGCAPFCSDEEVDSIALKYRLSTGLYAGAGGALVAALITYILRPEKDKVSDKPTVGVAASGDGARIFLGGQF